MKHPLLRLLNLPASYLRHALPRRIRHMLFVPLVIILIGSVAYPIIEGPPWTLFDGLYMTVITLTTLGYGEIPEPLSPPGRAFTMCLALGGIFVLFYIATETIRSIVTGEIRELLGKERMDDVLKHMNEHMIVCGYGRMGKIVCEELEHNKKPFVIIDSNPPRPDWNFHRGIQLQGDATEDETLRKAGIERAKAIISVVGSDAANLYITLSARLLNPRLVIIARAEEEEAEQKLRKVGATKVISPYLTGAHRAVQAVLKPGVLHFMEMATKSGVQDLQIEELMIAPTSPLAGASLRDSRLGLDYGVIVVRITRPDGTIQNAPPGEATIDPSSTLILLGSRHQLDRVEALAGPRHQPTKAEK